MVKLQSKVILLGVCLLLFSGCSSKGFFHEEEPHYSYEGNLYQVSEMDALQLAYSAMQTTLPDEKIMEITSKKRKGFLVIQEVDVTQDTRYSRFRALTYSYQVFVVPGQGVNAGGVQARGFYFETEGQGDNPDGKNILAQLEQNLRRNFDQTGTAVAVKSVQPGEYAPKTYQYQYQSSKKTGVEPVSVQPRTSATTAAPVTKPTPQPQAQPPQDTFEKLRKLKMLYDQGVISEQEFIEKKKELLDRI